MVARPCGIYLLLTSPTSQLSTSLPTNHITATPDLHSDPWKPFICCFLLLEKSPVGSSQSNLFSFFRSSSKVTSPDSPPGSSGLSLRHISIPHHSRSHCPGYWLCSRDYCLNSNLFPFIPLILLLFQKSIGFMRAKIFLSHSPLYHRHLKLLLA